MNPSAPALTIGATGKTGSPLIQVLLASDVDVWTVGRRSSWAGSGGA